MDNHEHFLDFAKKTAILAGKILLNHFGNLSSVESKTTGIDLVTIADMESEKFIVDQINSNYPNHEIFTEESASNNKISNYRWVIDPLDGTTNFVHELPIFAVSIGLQKNDETIMGVVYNPAADKCFWAIKNNGAFLNKKQINTTSTSTLSKSLLVTGFPYIHDKLWERNFLLFKELYGKTQGVRRLGAAALDLCFVAMGRFEGFWELELKPWDVCAGALIAEEAGGKVTDWDGSPMPFSGKRILATNNHIHNEMIQILGKKFS